MIAKAFLLTFLMAIASATPMTQAMRTVGYREAMDMFLDAWKKMSPCGFPSQDIPVLAPLTMDFYAFNYNNGETNLAGNVSIIRISGLNNFPVLSDSYEPTTLRATFDVLFPELQILGSYEAEGTIGIGGILTKGFDYIDFHRIQFVHHQASQWTKLLTTHHSL